MRFVPIQHFDIVIFLVTLRYVTLVPFSLDYIFKTASSFNTQKNPEESLAYNCNVITSEYKW